MERYIHHFFRNLRFQLLDSGVLLDFLDRPSEQSGGKLKSSSSAGKMCDISQIGDFCGCLRLPWVTLDTVK